MQMKIFDENCLIKFGCTLFSLPLEFLSSIEQLGSFCIILRNSSAAEFDEFRTDEE